MGLFDRKEDEDEIVEQPLPVGLVPSQAPQDPEPYSIQSPLVKDYLTKLYGDKYSDANRQKIIDQGPSPTVAGSLLSGLGAAFAGQDAAAAMDKTDQSARDAVNSKLSQFDLGRKNLVENEKLNRSLRDDATSEALKARERDPNSDESKLAQEAAVEMGVNHEIAGKLTAERFKALGPTYEKIFKIKQDKKDRAAERQAKLDAKLGGATEGQRATDKDYAKDYNEWTSTGRSTLDKNLQALREARDALSKNSSLTGGLTGALPDRLTSDSVLQQRQKVGSAIQSSLKATLGSQFTEKEGERILKNAYNEAASPKTNIASLDALIRQLQSQAQVNDAKAQHFQNKGTLVGFQGIPEGGGSGSWPRKVKKDGKVATVKDEDELKEAQSEGWI